MSRWGKILLFVVKTKSGLKEDVWGEGEKLADGHLHRVSNLRNGPQTVEQIYVLDPALKLFASYPNVIKAVAGS